MVDDKVIPPGRMTDNNEPQPFYGYIIVLCSFLILLVTFGINYSFGIFFNRLIDDLGWSRAVTSTGYALGQLIGGMLGIVTGLFSDRFGPKFIIIGCSISMAIGCFLMSQISQPWQLYIVYGIFIGIGYGGTTIPLSSTISRWFTRRRGTMIGIGVAGIGTGTVVMPLIINWFLSFSDWRTSFIYVGLLVLVIVIPAALFLKRDPTALKPETDQKKHNAQPSIEQGMTFRESIRTSQFWSVCIIYIMFGFYVQSIMVHIVPHAISLNLDAGKAALIVSFLGGGSIFGRIIMGTVSDRIGVKYTLIISISIIFIALIWLVMADSLWKLYIIAALFGFGYGSLIAMQTVSMATIFGLISLGTMVGVITCVYTVGGTIGPILTGYIFDVTGSYHIALIIWVSLAAFGLILAVFMRRRSLKAKFHTRNY